MPDFNFGHLIWEELGAAYVTLKRFGISDNTSVIMDAIDSKNDPLYNKLMSFFLPAITNETIRNTWNYLDSFNKDLVCFKKLVIPSFARVFFNFEDSFNEGKEPILFQFRNDVLSYYSLDPFAKPTKHRILINLKGESRNLNKTGRSNYRTIANSDEVYQFLKTRYSDIQVDKIDLSKLSLRDQLKEMLRTTVFITPNGGVSMILPFIAVNSYAIIMDYLGGQAQAFFKYDRGDSASMEVSFWNLWPHFTKMYYQVFSEKDIEWDFKGGRNYREDASVVVNLDRIEFMVNEALHQYEGF